MSDISGRGKAAKTLLDFPLLSPEPTLSGPHGDQPPRSCTSSLKPGLGPAGHTGAALQDVRTCRCPETCQGTEFPGGAWLALSEAPQPTPRAVRAHGAAVPCGHGCAQGAVVALRTEVQAEVLDGPGTGVAVITWPGGRNAQRGPLPEKFGLSSCPVTGPWGPGHGCPGALSPTSPLRPHPQVFAASHPLGTARWGLGDRPPCSRSLVGRPGTRRARSAPGGWRRCRGDTGWACVMLQLGAQGGHRSGSGRATASGHPPRGLAPWPVRGAWRDPRGGASPGLMPLRAHDAAAPPALSCPQRAAQATRAPGAH